jgi:PPOX class probable F420-dependent enzyme
MDAAVMRARVAGAPVGRLATVTPEGRPHVVPCCFALVAERIVSAVDDVKPKTTTALRRLDNLRAHPAAALLVDHYEDDWAGLWWVRVDGVARVVDHDAEGLDALTAKYPQYRAAPPSGPFVVIHDLAWRGWP